jgi:hypothetical protein
MNMSVHEPIAEYSDVGRMMDGVNQAVRFAYQVSMRGSPVKMELHRVLVQLEPRVRAGEMAPSAINVALHGALHLTKSSRVQDAIVEAIVRIRFLIEALR